MVYKSCSIWITWPVQWSCALRTMASMLVSLETSEYYCSFTLHLGLGCQLDVPVASLHGSIGSQMIDWSCWFDPLSPYCKWHQKRLHFPDTWSGLTDSSWVPSIFVLEGAQSTEHRAAWCMTSVFLRLNMWEALANLITMVWSSCSECAMIVQPSVNEASMMSLSYLRYTLWVESCNVWFCTHMKKSWKGQE